MLRSPEPVLLVIADISGYTSYLAGTEIEHAENVLQDLLETVEGQLAPLRLIAAEGDALFTFAPGGTVGGTQLLDIIDAGYFAFRRRLRDIATATTCECNACTLIPRLDLKFVCHAGRAVRQVAFGRENLVGPDVIAVHRLLKNHVVEETGFRAYALLSQSCIAQLGLDCPRLGMTEHTEQYDVGSIDAFVEDLEARWSAEAARGTNRLARKDAWLSPEFDFPAAPAVVWEHVTNPRLRQAWQVGVIRIDQDAPDGRPGVGTTNHCVHGRETIVEQVLDYHPFDSLTIVSTTPAGPLTVTWDFEPRDDGSATHMTLLCAYPRTLKSRAMWPVAKRLLLGRFTEGLNRLRDILAEEGPAAPEPPGQGAAQPVEAAGP